MAIVIIVIKIMQCAKKIRPDFQKVGHFCTKLTLQSLEEKCTRGHLLTTNDCHSFLEFAWGASSLLPKNSLPLPYHSLPWSRHSISTGSNWSSQKLMMRMGLVGQFSGCLGCFSSWSWLSTSCTFLIVGSQGLTLTGYIELAGSSGGMVAILLILALVLKGKASEVGWEANLLVNCGKNSCKNTAHNGLREYEY